MAGQVHEFAFDTACGARATRMVAAMVSRLASVAPATINARRTRQPALVSTPETRETTNSGKPAIAPLARETVAEVFVDVG